MSEPASLESFGYRQELKRALSLRDLVVFGIVFMSPMSSMTLFGIMAEMSQGHNVLCYLLGFSAMLFTAYAYGQMVRAFPIAGSTYSYTQRAVHPKLGFLAGWVMLLDYVLIPMLLYVVSALYAHEFIPAIPFWGWVLLYVVPITFVNIRGVELAAKTNTIMTILMIAALIAFFAASIKYALTGNAELFSWKAIYNAQKFSLNAVVAGSSLAVLSYLGFDAITTLTEEAKDQRQVGTAIILACIVQTFIYLGMAYFGTIVAPDVKAFGNPETAVFGMALKVGGAALQAFISVIIIVSGVSTALVGQASASRLLFGMGRDKVIPAKFFAHLHPTFKTPTYSIVFMAAIGLVGALTISMTTLSEMVTFGGLFGFMCVNLAVTFEYYIKGKSGKVLRHVVCPVLGLVVCAYILWGLSLVARVVGFTWMGLGVVYLVVRSLASEEFTKLLEKGAFAET